MARVNSKVQVRRLRMFAILNVDMMPLVRVIEYLFLAFLMSLGAFVTVLTRSFLFLGIFMIA